MTRDSINVLVVGLDGSQESRASLMWATTLLTPGGLLRGIHVIDPALELAIDATLGDSVALRHQREDDLDEWLEPARRRDIMVRGDVREGSVADQLLAVAKESDADVIAVGQHPHHRFGPQIVGHVTTDLLRHSDRPVIVVPGGWSPASEDSQ